MSCLCVGLYLLAEALWGSASQSQVSMGEKWAYRVIHITSHPNLGWRVGK